MNCEDNKKARAVLLNQSVVALAMAMSLKYAKRSVP